MFTDPDGLRARIHIHHRDEPSRFAIRDAILLEVGDDPAALKAIAQVALLGYITTVIRQPTPAGRADPRFALPALVEDDDTDDAPPTRGPAVFVDREGAKYGSPMLAARADARLDYRDRVHVSVKCGPDPRDEKFLADLTATELRFAAGVRRVHAQRTLSVATTFEALADALDKAKVTTVADLDPDIGLTILTGAAREALREAG
jgi:hypothetical protein